MSRLLLGKEFSFKVLIVEGTDCQDLDNRGNETRGSDLPARWPLSVFIYQQNLDAAFEEKLAFKVSDFTDPRPTDGPEQHTSYGALRGHLNELLDEGPLNPRDYRRWRAYDKTYAQALLTQLSLQDHIGRFCRRARYARASRVNIAIEVRSNHSVGSQSRATPKLSLHALQWEILEDIASWQGLRFDFKVKEVTVRRLVMPLNEKLKHTPTEPKAYIDKINILLVVAREASSDATDGRWNPSNVLRGLLTQQRRLQLERGSRHLIHLEVVRPGTLRDLEDHLSTSKEVHGKYFDAVHFDMHGDILDELKAILVFNRWQDDALETDDIQTKDIAELLHKYRISTVLLGACQSATAEYRISANLGQRLVEQGVQNVLAMSFNMADTMAFDLFKNFYEALLWRNMKLSASARIARQGLRNYPVRYSWHREKPVEVNDWFVPVVYSCGEDFSLLRNDEIPQRPPMKYKLEWFFCVWLLASRQRLLRAGVFMLLLCIVRLSDILHACRSRPETLVFALDGSLDCASPSLDLALCSQVHIGWYLTFHALRWTAIYSLVDYSFFTWQRWQFQRSLEEIENDKQNILRIEAALQKAKIVYLHGRRDSEYLQALRFMRSLSCVWRRTHAVNELVVLDCGRIQPSLRNRISMFWNYLRHVISCLEDDWLCRSFDQSVRSEISDDGDERHLVKQRRIVLVCNLHILWPERPTKDDLEAQSELGRLIREMKEDPTKEQVYLVFMGHRVGTGDGDSTWFRSKVVATIKDLGRWLEEPYNEGSETHKFGEDPRRSRRGSDD